VSACIFWHSRIGSSCLLNNPKFFLGKGFMLEIWTKN
jgi:hypothetical protein